MKRLTIKPVIAERRVIYIRKAFVNDIVVTIDDLEVLDALCDVDGMFGAVVVQNQEFKKKLEAAGLIRTNIRGGSCATSLLRDNLVKIQTAVCESRVPEEMSEHENETKPAKKRKKSA